MGRQTTKSCITFVQGKTQQKLHDNNFPILKDFNYHQSHHFKSLKTFSYDNSSFENRKRLTSALRILFKHLKLVGFILKIE